MKLKIQDKILKKCIPDHDWEDVVIPDYVKKIEQFAFNNLKLNKVVCPDITLFNVDYAFSACKIKEFILKSETTLRDENAYFINGCTIDNLYIDRKIIPKNFCLASKIKNLICADSVHIINEKAFLCGTIENINFGKNLEAIDDYTFERVDIYNELNFPKTLKYIGNYAFLDSTDHITKINFENKKISFLGVEAFGTNKIMDIKITNPSNIIVCDNIYFKHIHGPLIIPEGIETIFERAYFNSQEKQIELPSTLRYIEQSAFEKCTEIESVDIPDRVHFLSQDVFRDCKNLKDINLNKIQFIEENVFNNTAIANLKLPSSLLYIFEKAFFRMPNLKTIAFPANKDLKFQKNIINDPKIKLIIPDIVVKNNIHALECMQNEIDVVDTTLESLLSYGSSISEINQILKGKEEER